MRELRASCVALAVLVLALGASAQEADAPESANPPQPPAEAGAAEPEEPRATAVVVVASGVGDVTEDALSQTRAAALAAVSSAHGRHGRESRSERDPGLAARAAGCEDDACLTAVARDAQAGFLFVLFLERTGTGHAASVLLVDADAGQTVGSAVVDLPADPAGFVQAMTSPLGPLLSAVQPIGPTTGRLTINADQMGAAVFVDGERVGSTPLEPGEVEEGEHHVRVTFEGYQDFETTVDIPRGGAMEVSAELVPEVDEVVETEERPFWRTWWFWTAIGGAVATGLAVGLGVGLSQAADPGEEFGVPFPDYESR